MLKLLLWLRYLKQRKIVLLSIMAVAVSVALLIVVASLFKGFIRAYEQSAVDLIGDVLLNTPMAIDNYDVLIDELEQSPEIQAATATIVSRGLLHLGGGMVRAVEIWGIEPESLARVARLKPGLLRQQDQEGPPSFNANASEAQRMGGFVGIGLVTEPNEQTDAYDFSQARAMIGKQVVLTCGAVTASDVAENQPVRPRRRTVGFHVADILHTGNHLFDAESICLPLDELHANLYPGSNGVRVDRIQIKLAPGVNAETGKRRIAAVWQAFAERMGWRTALAQRADVVTARELQQRYMIVISQQMGMLMLIFGVIDVGVVTLVFCIFYLIVRLKQKDIAIVKSCGGSSMGVAQIFLGFGVCVGLVGAVAGTVLGWAFMHHINAIENGIQRLFGLKLWDSSVYLFERIPSAIDWPSVARIIIVAILATTVGAILPACLAAWTRPVKVLRYE
ncbi:ABC transporter permease [Planctomycetota bacterium]